MKAFIFIAVMLGLAAPAWAGPKFGVVSYWGRDTANYRQIPPGSLALINPDSGIFTGQGQTPVPGLDAFKGVISKGTATGVNFYGYVPTGYFRHDCNSMGKCQTWDRIEAQVKTYFAAMPDLAGIFFDETAPDPYDCTAYIAEYQHLRDLVHTYRADAKVIYNPGMPDMCAINAAQPGETVLLFESDGTSYLRDLDKIAAATQAAKARSIGTWHVINTVPTKAEMLALVAKAGGLAPDYLYIIDVSGDWKAGFNTYGDLPRYWPAEIDAINALK